MSITSTILLSLLLTLSVGCKPASQKKPVAEEKAEHPELRDLTVPFMKTKGKKIIDIITDLNLILKAHYPDHPHLPIIIEKHPYPKMDLSNEIVESNYTYTQMPLSEFLGVISNVSAHWRISENGFIIYKTWHRPQYDWDDEPPEDLEK